jgi:tetratricopeptide (TPR) repeat protein
VLELHKSQQKDASMFASSDAFHAWQQEEAQIQAMILRAIGNSWKGTGDYSQAHVYAEKGRKVLQAVGITSGIAWACLLNTDSGAYWAEGNFTAARNCLEESLAILEASTSSRRAGPTNQSLSLDSSLPPLITKSQRTLLGDPTELSGAHDSLGVVASSVGQYAKAIYHLQTALAILEEHDLIGLMGHVCGNLGAVHSMKAEYDLANMYYQRALQSAERTGDIGSQILVTGNLGSNAVNNGNLRAATAWLTDSLALAEQSGDRRMTNWLLIVLAMAQRELGEMRPALENIRRALAAERSLQNPTNTGLALFILADWRAARALMLRKLDTVSLLRPVYQTMQSAEQQRLLRSGKKAVERALALEGLEAETYCNAQLVLANILYYAGDLEQACTLTTQALTSAIQSEMGQLVGTAYHLLGDILSTNARYEEADISFSEAIKIFKKHEMRLYYARALHSYGTSLLIRSLNQSPRQKATHPTNTALLEKARASLREARDLFETCQASHDLAVVEQILAHPALLSSPLLSLKEK